MLPKKWRYCFHFKFNIAASVHYLELLTRYILSSGRNIDWAAARWHWTVSHTLSMETHLNSAYNSHITRCLCFRLHTLKVFLFPNPKCLTFFFFVPYSKWKLSNENIWCLEAKLWPKVIFSQCVQWYAETSGNRNSNI